MKQYPKVVQEIHNEFNTAADKLLQQANQVLENAATTNINKIERLQKIGFTKTKEVVEGKEYIQKTQISKEIADIVKEYQLHYPQKFISEGQVNKICEKYKLVCGPIADYKGFVPEKNLKDIENFKCVKPKHIVFGGFTITSFTLKSGAQHNDVWERIINDAIRKNFVFGTFGTYDDVNKLQLSLQTYQSKFYRSSMPHVLSLPQIKTVETSKQYDSQDLLICAPEKDMDTVGKTRFGFWLKKLMVTENPDPVVLKPVLAGFLILSAWGDEASDPLVVNEKMN